MALPVLPGDIAGPAALREAENDHFLQFLRRQDAGLLDRQVMAAHEQVKPQVDCLACGNCCRSLMINLEDTDIVRLAHRKGMADADFRTRYVEQGTHLQVMSCVPCHFLEEKFCTVYTDRPEACRGFPYLDVPGFKGRMTATLGYYAVCPIIFNVIEELKTALGFREAP